jgi:N-methylhydantoinase B
MLTVFQLGGTGARATKDGLNTTGFPSGVAGVPAEVIETHSPLVQHRRELRVDSGGAGEQRGGLGQTTEISCRTGDFTVSAMIDRTRFAAQGLDGAAPGEKGSLRAPDRELLPKRVHPVAPGEQIVFRTPGGGGYGRPFLRAPERVLADVIAGYVSIDAAKRDFGVAVRYMGKPDQLVRLPEDYEIDWSGTAQLRELAA